MFFSVDFFFALRFDLNAYLWVAHTASTLDGTCADIKNIDPVLSAHSANDTVHVGSGTQRERKRVRTVADWWGGAQRDILFAILFLFSLIAYIFHTTRAHTVNKNCVFLI